MVAARRAWPALVLGVVMLALTLEFWHLVQIPEYVGIDFHAYEAAASVGQQRGWDHIYDQGLVMAAERRLVADQPTLRFISPPPEAWLAAALTALPYRLAYVIWAALMAGALAFALAWSTSYRGPARLVAVGAAIVPWWVIHALYVGQIVPLVAASVLIAWRLMRERREVAAGIVLSLVVLKPQTAAIAPLALLAAGRFRVFAAWAAAAAILAGMGLMTLGPHGVADYIASLNGPPIGAYELTLGGALHLTGAEVGVSGAIIVGVGLAAAYRLRSAPAIALSIGVLASLLAAPYLYENDLCLLGAAGWIVWEERPTPFWRASLVTIWMLAALHLVVTDLGPTLGQWPLLELALFVALIAIAWQGRHAGGGLTRNVTGSYSATSIQRRVRLGGGGGS